MEKIRVTDLKKAIEGKVFRFPYLSRGRNTEGFLVKIADEIVAYENRCQHLPVKLDAGDGNFFSPDQEHFICQQHNALYRPADGFCVRGPCEGQSLKKLTVVVEDDVVYVHVA